VLAPTLKPDLPDWPGARLYCSTRHGGVSDPPYDSLNLGDHVGDEPVKVAENRRRLSQDWGGHPVFMQQVHGTEVVCIDDVATGFVPTADACWSRQTAKTCTIMVADCLPVLFYLPQARVVAAAHAGWRGLAGGVLENTLNTLAGIADLAGVKVWLGPCIGPGVFEVGEEVRAAFLALGLELAPGFTPTANPGKYLADLAWLARQRLQQQGVTHIVGNDSSARWCTYSNPDLYFSHRRDGRSGRFAAGIALV
jgi:YfiH family protein